MNMESQSSWLYNIFIFIKIMVHLGYSFYLNYYWCGALDPKTAKVDSRITAIAKSTKQYTN
jgi:hypothetical protein